MSSVDWPEYPAERRVTVVGRGFGAFGGAVVSWDDFEAHAVGRTIDDEEPIHGHTWTTQYGYSGTGIAVDDARSVSGSRSVKVDWSIDEHSIRAFGWANKGPYDTLYITYWRYMAGDYDPSGDNHKQFYLFGDNDGMPQLMPLMPGGTDTWGMYNNVGDSSISWSERNMINTAGWEYGNTRDVFQRWEFHTELNHPYTESNGVVRVWLDGELGIDVDDYRIDHADGRFTDWRLGHMAQGFTDTAKAWFDDVYVATTRARVELGNAGTYDACTERHLQYVDPTDWADDRITFDARAMEALSGDSVWLYVVDAEGNVSASHSLGSAG